MGTEQNDIKPLSYDLPYVVDITLYKYNYYDNLIINRLKKNTQYDVIPGEEGQSFIVTVDDFKEVLEVNFRNELKTAQSLTEVTIADGVNSIYFIDKIFNNFNNLEYVKVNVSNKRKFTRLLQVNESRKVINFEYKIITSVIDLKRYLETDEEFIIMNSFLREIGIIPDNPFDTGRAYYNVNAQDLMLMIGAVEEQYMNDPTFESTYTDALNLLYDLIDQKCEQDNTRLIIITDYPD